MAHEKKAADYSSATSKTSRSPVPAAKKDDIEDVAWALQTAEATWSRGDHADALKWIRRAAEAASEAEADDRALELAKAAADVASLLGPPPLPAATSPIPQAPPAPRITTNSKPPPPMPQMPPLPAGPASRGGSSAVTPPKFAGNISALPRPGQKGPTPPRVQSPAPVSRRGGQRSSPSFTDEATASAEQTKPNVNDRPKGRASVTNEAKKRSRNSKPPPEESSQMAPITARHPSVAEEIDAWPTASLVGDEIEDETQHTRIGTPAYTETAQRASARPPPMPGPPLVMSQAVRVVVWRAADGVHVAPAGTQVSAIAVEAVLVAMDPLADLAAWLSHK